MTSTVMFCTRSAAAAAATCPPGLSYVPLCEKGPAPRLLHGRLHGVMGCVQGVARTLSGGRCAVEKTTERVHHCYATTALAQPSCFCTHPTLAIAWMSQVRPWVCISGMRTAVASRHSPNTHHVAPAQHQRAMRHREINSSQVSCFNCCHTTCIGF